jgi:hypothetical protein
MTLGRPLNSIQGTRTVTFSRRGNARVNDAVNRLMAAVGVIGVPLLILVLPPLLSWGVDYPSPRAQFEAMAQEPASYDELLLQAGGAVCLLLACLGVLGAVARRGRGIVLGWVGFVIGGAGAVSLLLALGAELAVAFLLAAATDKAAMVNLALALNDWVLFATFLWTGLAGVFLALPIMALALWRGQFVSVVVPALFLVPVVLGFVPLPGEAANLVPSFALLIPSVWMAVRLLDRRSGAAGAPSTPRRRAFADHQS